MINHRLKLIFIHIPKCAGTSVSLHFFDAPEKNWEHANYDLLYGWCPIRKIHMQHATPFQLIETGLVSEDVWNSYYKFTIVRNPWDRAYSDYIWMISTTKIKGSFNDFINAKGKFYNLLNNSDNKSYRGDHLYKQTTYLKTGKYNPLNKIIKMENLKADINELSNELGFKLFFNEFMNVGQKKFDHYSKFYTKSKRELIASKYKDDIEKFNYEFLDKKSGLLKLKNLI